MKDVYVIEALRTPQGSFGGALADFEAPLLSGTVMRGGLQRAELDPSAVDEVIVGQDH